MNKLIVTVDIDWASESAIEKTLDFLRSKKIPPTVFTTHRSPTIESCLGEIEVGLHPYFGTGSSHGSSVSDVVKYIMDLPHNLPAFRCHRFGICNKSRQAMTEAGMLISSNTCTDLEIVPPFKDRFGLTEVPIFLEDGGYLWRNHPLKVTESLKNTILGPGIKVIIIHPMHFVVNTPHFKYMYGIKQALTRQEWNLMTENTINEVRWNGHGIKDFLVELLSLSTNISTLGSLIAAN